MCHCSLTCLFVCGLPHFGIWHVIRCWQPIYRQSGKTSGFLKVLFQAMHLPENKNICRNRAYKHRDYFLEITTINPRVVCLDWCTQMLLNILLGPEKNSSQAYFLMFCFTASQTLTSLPSGDPARLYRPFFCFLKQVFIQKSLSFLRRKKISGHESGCNSSAMHYCHLMVSELQNIICILSPFLLVCYRVL